MPPSAANTWFEEEKLKIPDLTEEQHGLLLLALGLATGTAMREGNRPLAEGIFRLTNAIEANNPNFTPYQVGGK